MSKHESVIEPARAWREENGVIYFSVTSDGTPGYRWIYRLRECGVYVPAHSERMLRSLDFRPTSGITAEIAILRRSVFGNRVLGIEQIRQKAYASTLKDRRLSDPNAEVACLILEKFSPKEFETMGLDQVVVMHEPIMSLDGDRRLLTALQNSMLRELFSHYGEPGGEWGKNDEETFAFALS